MALKIIEESGAEILETLIKKYLGDKESTLSKFLRENSKSEVAIEITPKKLFNYDYSKRMKDAWELITEDRCPTCGSKNFESIDSEKNSGGTQILKNECHNCKKFWYSWIYNLVGTSREFTSRLYRRKTKG